MNEGYRLIDTAAMYENEEQIGEALKAVLASEANLALSREEFFIVSKLQNEDKFDVEKALRDSLKRLGVDYLDLYLIHWPFGKCIDPERWTYEQPPLYKTWADMETCVRKGWCKAIGLSNFNCQLILDLLSYAEIPPAVNQIELHPYCAQRKLVQFCHKKHIEVMAYGPLTAAGRPKEGKPNALEDTEVVKIASRLGKTAAQVCLQWGMSNKHVVIPQTHNPVRLRENMDALAVPLTAEDVVNLDRLDRQFRIYDPHRRQQFGGIPIFD